MRCSRHRVALISGCMATKYACPTIDGSEEREEYWLCEGDFKVASWITQLEIELRVRHPKIYVHVDIKSRVVHVVELLTPCMNLQI